MKNWCLVKEIPTNKTIEVQKQQLLQALLPKAPPSLTVDKIVQREAPLSICTVHKMYLRASLERAGSSEAHDFQNIRIPPVQTSRRNARLALAIWRPSGTLRAADRLSLSFTLNAGNASFWPLHSRTSR
ncbi:hypothetical protein PoB_006844600 [Plakobranchus ocellatus]|uniref:Uncharacterized protein n=1 Tax=Plakobranchus ocellatus TaxID=259542 RepID=A0AAV4DDK2_9GAST|nr:hypothetical protein PoB_006844600 [Plakobranchus ocellatus]